MSNMIQATPGKANKADPNAPIHHFCMIIYVEGFGFQMHPLGKQFTFEGPSILIGGKPYQHIMDPALGKRVTPERPSILIGGRPYQRTMDPVFLAPAKHWLWSPATMDPQIREAGFCGEAYFTHSEHGLIMVTTPWWVSMSEAEQAAVRALPLLTDS